MQFVCFNFAKLILDQTTLLDMNASVLHSNTVRTKLKCQTLNQSFLPSTQSFSTSVSKLAALRPTANAPKIIRPTTKNFPQFFCM